MSSMTRNLIFALVALSPLVAGHGCITTATGDAGGMGSAIGIDPNTPRDGTKRDPFQQDTTRFKGDAADTVGETLGGGTNDIETGVKAVMQNMGDTMPQITPGGMVMMTLHQINGDGAGPYKCMIDSTGTAQQWTPMTVMQNVPGKNGNERDGAMTDFPLNAQVAADQTCDGTVAGQDNVCMVRCENPARAGPFGGVVAVQMGGGASAAGNSTASTGSTAGSTGSTASTGSTGSTASTASTGSTSSTGKGSTGSTTTSTGKGASGNAASNKGNAGATSSNASNASNGEADLSDEEDAEGMKRSLHLVGRFEKVRQVEDDIDPELLAELRADGEEI